MPVTLLLAMVGTLVVCDKTPTSLAHSERSDAQRLHAQIPYPRIDTFLGEQLHDDEEQVAQKIALLMEQAVQETPRKYGTAIEMLTRRLMVAYRRNSMWIVASLLGSPQVCFNRVIRMRRGFAFQ